MASVGATSQGSEVLQNYALENSKKKDGGELGKGEFLELMLAQLNNQSPLEPQDNGEFIAQLAQFSALEEMQGLNATVENFGTQFRSTQALQASAMVGQSVLVNASEGPMDPNGTMSGIVDLPGSTSSLMVSVKNATGELVKQVDMGQQFAGQVAFHWDGLNSDGEQMPPGKYKIEAMASYSSGTEQIDTLLSSNVDSVSLGTDGAITLNLAGVGSVPLSEVRQIN
ncbi:MAG: flagellar hook assembly protein FlgD [Pseudomonadales bacterium]|uniref:Basal-body rod modification protein FlgD n=1 Tax=Oleiphilus messinensis TaxID=141451 RepID=A0A1Y0ICB3_9GAMM|nr:flagellar hook assembly protein FlgD [Oleiphilus messinensis]ARU57105.1 flagellar hook capping protein [Oleiphilus messinensis]MCG8612737.1 flagellar hook assembly protein FlgD [Pseudomonadales bacterium]